MTIAEIERVYESKRRQMRYQASMDYTLADLIGRSVSRIYSSSSKMPEIYKAYPSLYSEKEFEEAEAQQKAELSAIRFRMFAEAHNKKIKQEVAKDK